MAYYTKDQLLAETPCEFTVDLIMRSNGTLHMVVQDLDWETAMVRALSALEDGLTVELEEHEWQTGAFDNEFDHQV